MDMQIREITKLKNTIIDLDAEREKMNQNVIICISLKKDTDFKICEAFKKFQNLIITGEINQINTRNLRTTIIEKENLLSDKTIELKRLEVCVNFH